MAGFCAAVDDDEIDARLLELWYDEGVAGAVCAATWICGHCGVCGVACRRFDLVSIPRARVERVQATSCVDGEVWEGSLVVEAWLEVLFSLYRGRMQGDDAAISAGISLRLLAPEG